MSGFRRSFEVTIEAPAPAVFAYCQDPRRIYADDPMYRVSEATLAAGGVGTTACVVARTPILTEEVAISYLESVPDQRIVFRAHPTMTVAGLRRFVISGSIVTWTWTFTPEGSGTRLAVEISEQAPPLWERALDALTARILFKQVRARLTRIKARVEEQAGAAVREGFSP